MELCASEIVSVALRPFDYPPHGHDIEIEACWSVSERLDIEILASLLAKTASGYDHRALWEIFGEGAMAEDLLQGIARELTAKSPPGAALLSVEGRWRGRRVRLKFISQRSP